MSGFAHDLFVSAKTESLRGLKLTLCGGGGIASIELPKIAREFRRHGAQVRFFVTENCLRFVGREALEWASEAPVIINPSGFAEHICHDDAVVVMPATADLLGKLAWGLCPDGVTTLAQSALGNGVPVLLCPTMHESLAHSPIVIENRRRLARIPGISFIPPRLEEGKEKAPTPENLVLEASHIINKRRKFTAERSPRILITYGGTRTALDSVRCITNLSSGALGREIIRQAYRHGIHVTALEGNVQTPQESLGGLAIHRVPEYSDMLASLLAVDPKMYDAIFHVAAVSDFVPESRAPGKIESDAGKLTLQLVRTRKFIELENLLPIPFQLACKLTDTTPAEGLNTARHFAAKHKLNALLWNQANVFEGHDHFGTILTTVNAEIHEVPVRSKPEIARCLVELFLKHWSQDHSSIPTAIPNAFVGA